MYITYPFFDYSFFETYDNTLNIKLNIPSFHKIIFKRETSIEGEWTNYFNVIKDKNNNILIFYRAVPSAKKKLTNYENEQTCLLESKDGINFKRYKIKNNIIYDKKNGISHNFFVLSNHNHLNKYLAIGGVLGNNKIKKERFVDGIYLLESNDCIKWNKEKLIINKSNALDQKYGTYFDALNCILYHTYYQKYYIYARHNIIINNRANQLFIYDNNTFDKVIKGQNLYYDKSFKNIYAPNIMQYPNSIYFISTAIIQTAKVYSTQRSALMISQDGINWKVLSDNWLQLKYQYFITMHIIEIGDEFYIYINNVKNQVLELWKINKDRISGIQNNEKKNKILITKKLSLKDNVYLNFKTFDDGYLVVTVLDDKQKVISSSKKLIGDLKNYKLFCGKHDIGYLKININNCILYSLKIDLDINL